MKKYIKINELSLILNIPTHKIRFWESKIKFLKIDRMRGKRIYSDKNISLLFAVKYYILDKNYSFDEINELCRIPAQRDILITEGEKLRDILNFSSHTHISENIYISDDLFAKDSLPKNNIILNKEIKHILNELNDIHSLTIKTRKTLIKKSPRKSKKNIKKAILDLDFDDLHVN